MAMKKTSASRSNRVSRGLTTSAARQEKFATKRPTGGMTYKRTATNRTTGAKKTTTGNLTPISQSSFKTNASKVKKTASSVANYGKLTRDEQRLHGKK